MRRKYDYFSNERKRRLLALAFGNSECKKNKEKESICFPMRKHLSTSLGNQSCWWDLRSDFRQMVLLSHVQNLPTTVSWYGVLHLQLRGLRIADVLILTPPLEGIEGYQCTGYRAKSTVTHLYVLCIVPS